MEKKIIEALKELGVPMGNLGFRYMKEALLILNGHTDMLEGITKPGGLYYIISKKCNTTPSRVERAIRHSIEQCFSKLNLDTLQKYFGNTADMNSGKLSNRNFLASLSYVIYEDKMSGSDIEVPALSSENEELCAICGSNSKLIKVNSGNICRKCLLEANLNIVENM